jgi:hypothetical protein
MQKLEGVKYTTMLPYEWNFRVSKKEKFFSNNR